MISAEVMLWGTRIGIVSYDEISGYGSFEYDVNFITSGIEVSPIMMPLSRRVYSFPELNKKSFHGLPGLLADSLPDKFGNIVINEWLQSQGRTSESFSPVERLCYTGKRGMGALEFVPAISGLESLEGSIQVDYLVELASRILSDREKMHISLSENSLLDIIKVGTSAGGARAKAVIAWNKQTNDICSGQIKAGDGYEYWLIKFDGVSGNRDKETEDGSQYTRIEYAYYLMAKAAGINMSECELYKQNGLYHFMTRRFDRENVSGDKIHMQTLGGLAHLDFNIPGICGYENAAAIMRKIHVSQKEIIQFFRRMVFNIMAKNMDDHVKNISFLMNRSGKWSLSPAYDITFAYNPEGLWTGSHQMSVNGKRQNIDLCDIIASGENMGLKKKDINNAINDVRSSLIRWNEFAERACIKECIADKIKNNFEII